jgi:DNA repair protein RadB
MEAINLPEPMNSLLKGLEPKSITNLFGGPGTGKTNLCLMAAAECAKRGGTVVFIDTEGGFSLERLKQLAPDYKKILERIKLVEPKNFEEQGKAIKLLSKEKPDMVIVDSAVALYRLENSEKLDNSGKKCVPDLFRIEANRELSRQLSLLSNLARETGIPVLITSHSFKNWDTEVYDVVGGDSIKYWSKAIVHLEKTGKTSERKATVVKHRFVPEGESAKFMIVENGIKPSGFRIF